MSDKYDLVKSYYDRGLWSAERVQNAVGKWITQEEADAILAPPAPPEPPPEEEPPAPEETEPVPPEEEPLPPEEEPLPPEEEPPPPEETEQADPSA